MNRQISNKYLVKRTPNGRVRFSMGDQMHLQLCELLKDVADSEAGILDTVPDVYIEAGRQLAQELLTRPHFMATMVGENRFTLKRMEATLLLALLWPATGDGAGGWLLKLNGDLHQLLY